MVIKIHDVDITEEEDFDTSLKESRSLKNMGISFPPQSQKDIGNYSNTTSLKDCLRSELSLRKIGQHVKFKDSLVEIQRSLRRKMTTKKIKIKKVTNIDEKNSLYLESEKDEEVEKLYKIWDSVNKNDMGDRKS